MEMMDAKRKKRAEAGKKGAEKRWENRQNDSNADGKAIAMPKQNDSNAIAMPKQSQCDTNGELMAFDGNKIKLNKIKLNKTKLNKNKVVVSEINEAENLADEPATTTEQKQISDVLNFYENHFGMTSDYIRQSILKWCNDLNPALVKRALEISVEDNVLKFRYANAILVDWAHKGIDTLEKALAEGNARQKSKQNNYNKPSGYVEIVPDWVK